MSTVNFVPSVGQTIIQGLVLCTARALIAHVAYHLSEEEGAGELPRTQQRMGLISALDGIIQLVVRVIFIHYLKIPDALSPCPLSPLKVVCFIGGDFLSMGLCTYLGSDRLNFKTYLRSMSCNIFSRGVANIGSGLFCLAWSQWYKV